MTDAVSRAVRTLWLLMLLRGVLAAIFGLYALFSPGSALLALVYVFGFYALMDGVTAIVLGIRHRRAGHWGWQLAQGAVSVVAGLVALFWPGPTVLALVLIVAVWSVVLGVTGIVEALAARHQGEAWGWPVVGGVVLIVFGVVLLASPGAGALLLLWVIGVSTLALGAAFIAWALRLRSEARAGTRGG
jgi:uncharacterized membrane protein HdeD (DUF308 family)